ncbi:unnamed protein product [Ectocarpus fasciculatus]
MIRALIVAAAAVGCSAYTEDAVKDQITNLPGAENLDVTFNQFSGYLTVDDTKQMHYWFVEAMNNPADAPVAFWTNGGPGCSGLLGFLTEQGPFHVNKDMTLNFNEYAWNQVANMVFIESPCGVGYSYSTAEDPTEDYKMDDQETAEDNYDLIQAFMARFPEYSKNKLYISSESYGGHYMPTLAKQIVDMNTAGENPQLNFKGFAVGNPFTETYSAFPAMLETYWGHQMISAPLWTTFQSQCVEPKVPNMTICSPLFYDMYLGVGNVNPYAIDYPVCLEDSGPLKGGRAQRHAFMEHLVGDDVKLRNALLKSEEYEPCAEDYATEYMNLPEVKAALHVNSDITWGMCSRSIRYSQTDGKTSMVPIYSYLIDGGFDLDILVFSGDNDAVCATIGVQHWIWDLGYKVTGRMYQPYEVAGQMAGYATKWADSKLGFVTVHGAGHEVPAYKPEVALELWTKYLNGEWTN